MDHLISVILGYIACDTEDYFWYWMIPPLQSPWNEDFFSFKSNMELSDFWCFSISYWYSAYFVHTILSFASHFFFSFFPCITHNSTEHKRISQEQSRQGLKNIFSACHCAHSVSYAVVCCVVNTFQKVLFFTSSSASRRKSSSQWAVQEYSLYTVTCSVCCPGYFNLSSNPATSFSLFTLLMGDLNEDNTTR